MLLSHTQGPTDLPLVDETIGAHLARIVERFPDREALILRHEHYRATYRELWEQVDATARGLLARFKIPRYWRIVDGFPMTVTGKVQKYRLRELAVAA